jgi:hypothetical protein
MPSWLEQIWDLTSTQVRYVAVRRSWGGTLDSIAKELGCSRENVRLIQKKLIERIRSDIDELNEVLKKKKGSIFPRSELAQCMEINNLDLLNVLCHEMQFRVIRTSSTTYYVRGTPNWVPKINEHLPLTEQEVSRIVIDQASSDRLGIAEQLTKGEWIEGLGFVRKTSSLRDEIFLRLLQVGEPLPEGDLATMTGVTIRNLRAHIDRDHRLVRNNSLDLVGLTAWRIDDFAIKTAQEALTKILEDVGPLKQSELIKRATAIFPRTHARYIQALDDPAFGLTERQEIGLVSNGAIAAPAKEPMKHNSIQEHSTTRVSLVVQVTNDLMRGSGVPVHKRLGWLVGLRKAGDSKDFRIGSLSLSVRRSTGNVALSSMRSIVHGMQLQSGCKFELALDLENDLFGIRGVCSCHWLQPPNL